MQFFNVNAILLYVNTILLYVNAILDRARARIHVQKPATSSNTPITLPPCIARHHSLLVQIVISSHNVDRGVGSANSLFISFSQCHAAHSYNVTLHILTMSHCTFSQDCQWWWGLCKQLVHIQLDE
jgi:hypothetical protein